MTKQDLTVFANNKETAFVSEAISVDSGLGSSFAQVVQNNDILACAKDYLQLCSNLPQEVSLRLGKKASVSSLPSDVVSVERGVGVLCAAYAVATNNHDKEVCNDVENELKALSTFYQGKVAQAYFSACNILLDADDVSDRPDILKLLKQSRNSLQQVHCAWPMAEEENTLTSFFEKVDFYGRQLGIDGRVYPEKKAEKVSPFIHFSPKMAINERGA